MFSPIHSSSISSAFPPHSAREGKTAFAKQLTRASTVAPSGSMPFSRTASTGPVERIVQPRPTVNVGAPISENELKAFFTLYSTNEGCKTINGMMRGRSLKPNMKEVTGEIGRTHGDEQIPSYRNAGVDIRGAMTSIANKDRLEQIANELYGRADPSKTSSSPLNRGQGITPAGVDKLVQLRKDGSPIKASQFLSCDKKLSNAKKFAQDCQPGEKPVVFQIWGYSGVALRPYFRVEGESETLFMPNATFRIDKIGENPITHTVVVHLKEIPYDPKAVPLPY